MPRGLRGGSNRSLRTLNDARDATSVVGEAIAHARFVATRIGCTPAGRGEARTS